MSLGVKQNECEDKKRGHDSHNEIHDIGGNKVIKEINIRIDAVTDAVDAFSGIVLRLHFRKDTREGVGTDKGGAVGAGQEHENGLERVAKL